MSEADKFDPAQRQLLIDFFNFLRSERIVLAQPGTINVPGAGAPINVLVPSQRSVDMLTLQFFKVNKAKYDEEMNRPPAELHVDFTERR